MSLKINDTAPNFNADTTHGKINFYDWSKEKWVVIFSHPKKFYCLYKRTRKSSKKLRSLLMKEM